MTKLTDGGKVKGLVWMFLKLWNQNENYKLIKRPID